MKVSQSFKLPEEVAQQAEAYWKKLGITKTQFFTEATIEKLSDTTAENTLQELRTLQTELTEMRMEQAVLARALLRVTTTNYEFTEEGIKEWLTTNLKYSGHALDC